MQRVIDSNPLRAGNRASFAVKAAYASGVAAIVGAILAAPSYAQDPAGQMIDTLTTGVLGLLGAGVAVVVAVALFYAGKAFVSRIRS